MRILIIVLLIVLPVAAVLDWRIASWAHQHGLHDLFHRLRWPMFPKIFGHYGYCTIPIALIVTFATRASWRGGALIAVSGIIAGICYSLAKWFVGRTRPFSSHGTIETPFAFHPFNQGIPGLWKAENQSFPSGHASLAFSTAAALCILFPNWRWTFFCAAALTAIERVLENVHYPSDVVAGAIFGILSAMLAHSLLRRLDHRIQPGVAA